MKYLAALFVLLFLHSYSAFAEHDGYLSVEAAIGQFEYNGMTVHVAASIGEATYIFTGEDEVPIRGIVYWQDADNHDKEGAAISVRKIGDVLAENTEVEVPFLPCPKNAEDIVESFNVKFGDLKPSSDPCPVVRPFGIMLTKSIVPPTVVRTAILEACKDDTSEFCGVVNSQPAAANWAKEIDYWVAARDSVSSDISSVEILNGEAGVPVVGKIRIKE